MKRVVYQIVMSFFLVLVSNPVAGYPIDGYGVTGIRRLEMAARISQGTLPGPALVPGQRMSVADIRLTLASEPESPLPAPDPELQQAIAALFPDRDASYSLALMDISPGRPHRYAALRETRAFPPGSVGKLAIAAGLFTELARLFPLDTEKRRDLLRTRMITADRFSQPDHHDVPFFDPATNVYASRPIQEGDTFSLYEWVDHMLSASANSAASMVWKELLLMRGFSGAYPPSREDEQAFFTATSKKDLRTIAMDVVNTPMRAIGIAEDDWYLGSFFTANGKDLVPGDGNSRATPLGLLRFLLAVEQGRVVDPWSSLEIKRLMYMTARRIRYASSPALAGSAVYFKSGSLYRCRPETGYKCRKYMGNLENTMNSVAIVEHPDGRIYLVGFMSNVLRKNSAVEHQTLATMIDRVLAE